MRRGGVILSFSRCKTIAVTCVSYFHFRLILLLLTIFTFLNVCKEDEDCPRERNKKKKRRGKSSLLRVDEEEEEGEEKQTDKVVG